jgi:hypothetical protein
MILNYFELSFFIEHLNLRSGDETRQCGAGGTDRCITESSRYLSAGFIVCPKGLRLQVIANYKRLKGEKIIIFSVISTCQEYLWPGTPELEKMAQ